MKLDHPSDVCFKHSAISFGVPDMPPPDVGRSMGPISLHNAIEWSRGESNPLPLRRAKAALILTPPPAWRRSEPSGCRQFVQCMGRCTRPTDWVADPAP